MRVLLLWLLLVSIAPALAPYDPMETNPTAQFQTPNTHHLLGTDLLGRDVLSRVLYGGQHTLVIAALATGIAVVPGVSLGLWRSRLVGVLINAILAFPGLLLALVIMTLLGQGAFALALAIGITQIAPCARVTRAAVISVSTQTYIEAANSLGASRRRLIFRHTLPNILPTLLAYTGVIFAYSILNGAALSFLGLGGEPGIPDWGVMLYEGRQAFRTAPWIAAAPGLGITITVVLINRAADRITRL
jgi:ABC-type dipeptide/oligopeptide/nickel transport system permease subunit